MKKSPEECYITEAVNEDNLKPDTIVRKGNTIDPQIYEKMIKLS
jgi:hypothetical protein